MKYKRENQFWDSFAEKYDDFIAKYANRAYSRILFLTKKEITSESKVLEIGTGTGLIAFAIAKSVHQICAIDYSTEMISIANKKLHQSGFKNVDFKVNSACIIDYPDNTFDIIIASNVFHLLKDPELVLKEIKRLLTKNGKIILPTYCHGQNLKSRIISLVISLSGFKVANRWSFRQFHNFIEKNGYTIQKEEIIMDKIPLSFIVASRN